MDTVAKRRSTTRVGRDNPRPARVVHTGHVMPLSSRYWATAPVLLDGVLYRVLESTTMQRVVQEWAGEYWSPSLLPLYRVADAMLATPEHLTRLRVPESDWHATPHENWSTPTVDRIPPSRGAAPRRREP